MALIKCPECGRENVSDSATSCPNCGYNISKHMEAQEQSVNEQINSEELPKEKLQNGEKKATHSKWIYIIVSVIIIAVLILFVGNGILQKQKKKKSYRLRCLLINLLK